MLFHSNDFLFFLTAFLLAYYLCRSHLGVRNLLILVASYIFYGWWDYRFVGLLFLTSILDFAIGLGMGHLASPGGRRTLLGISIVANLGILGVFKYFDFFQECLGDIAAWIGTEVRWQPMHLLLPVGVSFYTFQSMSYVIDVYRQVLRPATNPIQFLSYVAFFPQLVAGPIERATHLLPQFARTLTIDARKIEQGIWLCLWGLFKKVALADNLAPLVEIVFDQEACAAPLVVLGTIAFGLQIYCDFSAYSDLARGTANLLGFDLMINFNLPYQATDLRDFWRRWHISLSTWIRDYVYHPLGGNRVSPSRTQINLLLTMLLAGLWHGAATKFVLWGLWHGMGLAVNRWWVGRGPNRWTMPAPLAWALTMIFVFYGWMLFRAKSLEQIQAFTLGLISWSRPPWLGAFVVNLLVLVVPLFIMEAWQSRRQNLLAPVTLPFLPKALLQGALLLGIVVFWERESAPFIYFQF